MGGERIFVQKKKTKKTLMNKHHLSRNGLEEQLVKAKPEN